MRRDPLAGTVPHLDVNKAMELATVEESLFVWMTIHGNLCLALRHPDNTGPSGVYVQKFVDKLGKLLVERRLLTQAQMDYAMSVERSQQQ